MVGVRRLAGGLIGSRLPVVLSVEGCSLIDDVTGGRWRVYGDASCWRNCWREPSRVGAASWSLFEYCGYEGEQGKCAEADGARRVMALPFDQDSGADPKKFANFKRVDAPHGSSLRTNSGAASSLR